MAMNTITGGSGSSGNPVPRQWTIPNTATPYGAQKSAVFPSGKFILSRPPSMHRVYAPVDTVVFLEHQITGEQRWALVVQRCALTWDTNGPKAEFVRILTEEEPLGLPEGLSVPGSLGQAPQWNLVVWFLGETKSRDPDRTRCAILSGLYLESLHFVSEVTDQSPLKMTYHFRGTQLHFYEGTPLQAWTGKFRA